MQYSFGKIWPIYSCWWVVNSPIYWDSNHPNWFILFRGVAQPPTRNRCTYEKNPGPFWGVEKKGKSPDGWYCWFVNHLPQTVGRSIFIQVERELKAAQEAGDRIHGWREHHRKKQIRKEFHCLMYDGYDYHCCSYIFISLFIYIYLYIFLSIIYLLIYLSISLLCPYKISLFIYTGSEAAGICHHLQRSAARGDVAQTPWEDGENYGKLRVNQQHHLWDEAINGDITMI